MNILTVELRLEEHVVLARQRARQIAALLGFSKPEQTRIATAVSEIARNALQYAQGGQAQFAVETKPRPLLRIQVVDGGPGIESLEAVLDGRFVSQTGPGRGMLGSRRLMDAFDVRSSGSGTTVSLGKLLPPEAPRLAPDQLRELGAQLTHTTPDNPLLEVQQQNQELLIALEELRGRQAEVERLNASLEAANRELDDTNRGIVALYSELDETAQKLHRTSEAKSRFLRQLGHEIRSPLGSTLRLCELLATGDQSLSLEQAKQVGLIRRSTQAVAELVNNLLDLAKIESGKTDIQLSEVSVEEMFAELRGMLRPLASSEHVTLRFEESGIAAFTTDAGKLAQILRNLITNALKFTEKGEVCVSAKRGQGGTAVFSVRDTGIGVSPEDLDRVFEEFAQVRHPLQAKVKGTGLGLPLSRSLAVLLGGALILESELGLGSTFTVTLPLTPAPEMEPLPASKSTGRAGEPGEALLTIGDDATRGKGVSRGG